MIRIGSVTTHKSNVKALTQWIHVQENGEKGWTIGVFKYVGFVDQQHIKFRRIGNIVRDETN